MLQIVLFCQKITYFRNSGTKLQLFFHICKRTRENSVILAEKCAWYAFCACVYGLFIVPLQRILCVNTQTLYEFFRNYYQAIRQQGAERYARHPAGSGPDQSAV